MQLTGLTEVFQCQSLSRYTNCCFLFWNTNLGKECSELYELFMNISMLASQMFTASCIQVKVMEVKTLLLQIML
jgi:hypothetical protein